MAILIHEKMNIAFHHIHQYSSFRNRKRQRQPNDRARDRAFPEGYMLHDYEKTKLTQRRNPWGVQLFAGLCHLTEVIHPTIYLLSPS